MNLHWSVLLSGSSCGRLRCLLCSSDWIIDVLLLHLLPEFRVSVSLGLQQDQFFISNERNRSGKLFHPSGRPWCLPTVLLHRRTVNRGVSFQKIYFWTRDLRGSSSSTDGCTTRWYLFIAAFGTIEKRLNDVWSGHHKDAQVPLLSPIQVHNEASKAVNNWPPIFSR